VLFKHLISPFGAKFIKEEKMRKAILVPLLLGSTAVLSFADKIYGKDIKVDYTNFYSAVGLAIGVTIVVMLARKAKSFLRS